MNWSNGLSAALTHLEISFLGVLAGCLVGLPLAALLVRLPKLQKPLFAVVDALQTVPTLAMLTFVMLIFGLNDSTVIVTIFLYSLFPILRNAYVGLTSVDAGTIRAGRGIGMTSLQIFTMVRFPVAVPMILTGIRLAIVSALGVTATGVFIGAGGLGMLIWRGIQTRNTLMMLSGAIPVSLLAVLFEYAIGHLEKKLTKQSTHTGGVL
mgnify:CR=1 FL=1